MTQKKDDTTTLQITELTTDLQRTRADFENYRKRMEAEKSAAMENGATKTILKLLPVIDTIDRAVSHMPADIANHQWVQGVGSLAKQVDKMLAEVNIKRIIAHHGTEFNPEFHQAIQVDDATGDKEVIAEELQPGYIYNGSVIRPALVKVTRQ